MPELLAVLLWWRVPGVEAQFGQDDCAWVIPPVEADGLLRVGRGFAQGRQVTVVCHGWVCPG